MGRALQDRGNTVLPLGGCSRPEDLLASRDPVLAGVIADQTSRWFAEPIEDPIWGLVRIVMAQQISTQVACRIAERVKFAYPSIATPLSQNAPPVESLRALGLSQRRAQCCIQILQRCDSIRNKICRGETWESAVAGIKGIGPWTLAVFRIMVLRDPDVLPLGDVGLARAIANVYGARRNLEQLAEKWRPFRSVACWYLWRTLGNEQLG